MMTSYTPIFDDRQQAGRALAEALAKLELPEFEFRPVVLALPRGGVPIGFEVAAKLGAPLDVLVVRKLGVPGHEELALGAIATGGARTINEDVVRSLQISPDTIERVAERERVELERRERVYRGDAPPISVEGHTVILVDDGLATGATLRAAAISLRQRNPRSIVAAVPVGAASSCARIRSLRQVDQMVCLAQPEPFYGVGMWYREFDQTSDDEVHELLERNRQAHPDHPDHRRAG